MTKQPQTFYNYKVTGADGKEEVREYKSEKQYNEAVEDAKKAGAAIEVLKAQTFDVSTADSIDEILTVTPNAEVALNYYNYGLTLAQHNVKRELMTDNDWQPIEGNYDLLADVQQPKEKRVADPLSSARRSLMALWTKLNPGTEPPSEDEINAVLAQFSGAGAQNTQGAAQPAA
jgi:hypothetical protein